MTTAARTTQTGALRGALRRFLHRRTPLLTALAAAILALATVRACAGASAGSAEASLAAAMSAHGLAVDPATVLWLSEPGVFAPAGALFPGSQGEGGRDIFYASVRATNDGQVLDAWGVTNLTRSASADDHALTASSNGRFAVYASRVLGGVEAFTVLDLEGEPGSLTEGWPARARVQNAITNVQETGRSRGFGRRRFTLLEPSDAVSIEARGDEFVVALDQGSVHVDPSERIPTEGADLVDVQERTKGMPGTITWVVDTVRNTSFVGPGPIEWLEHRVFSIKDSLAQAREAWFGASRAEQEQEVAEDLGATAEELRRRVELSVTVPELGFPPPAIDPVYSTPLEGEGQWVPVADDPFVATYPGAPTPFFTTYLRPDPDRSYARVYIVLWDPRLVQLRMVAGTREPESATGATGPGMAPRDPKAMRRLVAGFNGGFQALHGEFGMMGSGRVYLPPKPWAATVAVRQDGSVAMGSWTDPPDGEESYRESWAVDQIPDDFVDYRQNLTSVVEGERYNPWARWWWGAAPLNAQEQVRIDRSGLCITEGGFIAYYWGRSLGPDALGEAMLRTGCVRGMHLDMNARHTGFELYNIQPAAQPWPSLSEDAMGDGRYQGPVPHGDGWSMRARLLVRSMTPMRFPRYAGRDPRDFFYLTLRPVLPGPPATDGVEYDTEGLPHDGFPYAFARARFGEDEGATQLIRIDPRRVTSEPPGVDEAGREAPRPLAYLAGAELRRVGSPQAFVAPAMVGVEAGVGDAPEGAEVWAGGGGELRSASAALGVDGEGFVVYAERGEGDSISLQERLEDAGVTSAVALPETVRLVFQAEEGVFVGLDSYEREVDVAVALPLWSRPAPRTEVLFPDTQPRRYVQWARMQDTRVRYFRDEEPTFSRNNAGRRDEDLDED